MTLDDATFLAYQYRSNQYHMLLNQLASILKQRKERDNELEVLLKSHLEHMR